MLFMRIISTGLKNNQNLKAWQINKLEKNLMRFTPTLERLKPSAAIKTLAIILGE